MSLIFPAHATPTVEVAGTDQRFPVHRIYCVGRNYAEHVREMGAEPHRAPPCFFSKPADAVVANGWKLAELRTENVSLENVFAQLTRR